NGVDALRQLAAQALVRIQRARHAEQMQGEALKDAAVAYFVGVRERRARDVAAKSCEVQLAGVAAQARGDVAQAGTRSQLRENHAQQLIPVRERERWIPPRV